MEDAFCWEFLDGGRGMVLLLVWCLVGGGRGMVLLCGGGFLVAVVNRGMVLLPLLVK